MGGILDPFLRGFNESLMDTNLSGREIQNLKGITAIFGKEIKSKLDAQFGFILGFSYAKFLMQFLILRDVKVADIVERDESVASFEEFEVEPIGEDPTF